MLTTVARTGQQQRYWGVSFRPGGHEMNTRGQAVPLSGVLGGGALKADDYAALSRPRVPGGYLPAGGAAVKVAVVGDGGAADRLESALAAAAAQHGGVYVSISADSTRVHMIDQIFFAISRAVDWEAVAAAHVRAAYGTLPSQYRTAPA